MFDTWTLRLAAGVGAEWFPTEQVGVAASTGVAVEYLDGADREPLEVERRIWSVDVFRSQLTLNLYF